MLSNANRFSSEGTEFENMAPFGMQQQKQIIECICTRPKAKVLCQKCGYSVDGCRARRSCPCHPKVINLMDMAECPKCRAKWSDLQEITTA